MEYYEVIESYVWQNDEGYTASIYGAVPWQSENQRLGEGWRKVQKGWTVKNPITGQVGVGRPPCKTFADACELALRLGKPTSISIGD